MKQDLHAWMLKVANVEPLFAIPLLVLQLDQGKVGAAGAAFLGHASVIIRQLVSLSALSIFLQDMLHFGSVCVGY